MQLKPEEISKIIRAQLKHYENAIEQSETGMNFFSAILAPSLCIFLIIVEHYRFINKKASVYHFYRPRLHLCTYLVLD